MQPDLFIKASLFMFQTFVAVYAPGSSVTLSSSLNIKLTANPQETVVYTCTTRGSGIVNWFSDEYIGTDGLPLQIIAAGNTSTIPGKNDPNTVATRINVTHNNGEIVIVSELRIIVSSMYQTATVSCDDGGAQSRQSITFGITSQEDVVLTSTLNAEFIAYPQEVIIFTCLTRGSGILNWFSDEYLGVDSLPLQILAVGDKTKVEKSYDNYNVTATRINVSVVHGVIIISSELMITASLRSPNATITCSKSGSLRSISFQTINRPYEITSEAETETAVDASMNLNQTNDDHSVSKQLPVPIIIGGVVVGSIGLLITVVSISVIVVLHIKVGRSKRQIESKDSDRRDSKCGSEAHVSEDILCIEHQPSTQDCDEQPQRTIPEEATKSPVSKGNSNDTLSEILREETHEPCTDTVNSAVSSSDMKKATHRERRRLTSTSSVVTSDSELSCPSPSMQRKECTETSIAETGEAQ